MNILYHGDQLYMESTLSFLHNSLVNALRAKKAKDKETNERTRDGNQSAQNNVHRLDEPNVYHSLDYAVLDLAEFNLQSTDLERMISYLVGLLKNRKAPPVAASGDPTSVLLKIIGQSFLPDAEDEFKATANSDVSRGSQRKPYTLMQNPQNVVYIRPRQ